MPPELGNGFARVGGAHADIEHQAGGIGRNEQPARVARRHDHGPGAHNAERGSSSVVSRASTPPMPPPGAGSISSTGRMVDDDGPGLAGLFGKHLFLVAALYLRNTLGLPGKAWPSNSQPPFLPSFMSMPHECHISMISRLRSRERPARRDPGRGPPCFPASPDGRWQDRRAPREYSRRNDRFARA